MTQQLTKTSSDNELKSYFESVLALAKTNEEFPVDLDDVWSLAYTRKDSAVKVLKRDCIEGIDYQPSQNGKVVSINEIHNGIEVKYHLSVSCMEYVVARKIKSVFEVYRKVFHRTAEIIEQKSFQVPQSFSQALLLAAQQQEQIEKQQLMLTQQSEQITALEGKVEQMNSKVSYFDSIMQNPSTMTVTQIAQDYGMSAKHFNKVLFELGIQHKVNDQWILYTKYMVESYVHSKQVVIDLPSGATKIKLLTEWTQKGRLFLYNKLKDNGIIPLIEQ